VNVRCVERVLAVLEARVNLCRGESLRRLAFFCANDAQKEKPLELSHSRHTPSLVGGGQEAAERVSVMRFIDLVIGDSNISCSGA